MLILHPSVLLWPGTVHSALIGGETLILLELRDPARRARAKGEGEAERKLGHPRRPLNQQPLAAPASHGLTAT